MERAFDTGWCLGLAVGAFVSGGFALMGVSWWVAPAGLAGAALLQIATTSMRREH